MHDTCSQATAVALGSLQRPSTPCHLCQIECPDRDTQQGNQRIGGRNVRPGEESGEREVNTVH